MRHPLQVKVIVAIAALLAGPASQAASSPRRYATLDEKTVAEAMESSPQDYLAAVVEVESRCEVRREDRCFDRIRILDLIAQPPEPARQRSVGDDLFLFSGKEDTPPGEDAHPHSVLFVVPMPAKGEPAVYGARWMSVEADATAIGALRAAVDAVRSR